MSANNKVNQDQSSISYTNMSNAFTNLTPVTFHKHIKVSNDSKILSVSPINVNDLINENRVKANKFLFSTQLNNSG
jgi:hypothetical protein